MKNFIVLLFFSLYLSMQLHAQDQNNQVVHRLGYNAVDVTFGGNGLLLSANYSRVWLEKTGFFADAGVGIGFTVLAGGMTLPHSITFNLGKKSSFLMLGIGGIYWQGKTDSSGFEETATSYNLAPMVGWRKNFKSHILLKIYANPIINVSGEPITELGILPFAGIGIGYMF